MWRSAHDWRLRGDALAVGTQPSPVAATLQQTVVFALHRENWRGAIRLVG